MNKTWEGDEVIEVRTLFLEELAKPKDHPNFDNNHLLAMNRKVELINTTTFNIN